MFTVEIYFILNLFLVLLALIFFIFKKIEYKGRKLKYFFIILVTISLLENELAKIHNVPQTPRS